MGVPGGTTFNLYDDMKRKLIAAGVKADEVAFVHTYKSAQEKATLFEQLNQGKIRILIASTALAGEGANFQRLLKASYELEPGLGWKKTATQQRSGRLVRQRNLNPTVRLKRYIAPGGDAYLWQTIERKALASDQILKYGPNQDRVQGDIGDFHPDFSLVKAAAAGNSLARDQVAAQLDITRLRSLQSTYLREQAEARQTMDEAKAEIDLLTKLAIPMVAADNHIPIAELSQQITEAQELLQRPFDYEDELQQATQRLAEIEQAIAKEQAGPLTEARKKRNPWALLRKQPAVA
jgi:hypothetical protein